MRQNDMNAKSSETKSVGKTLAILSTFTPTSPIQRTSDIAAKLGMSISTVSRHLNTLFDAGFLGRDEKTGCYHLGIRILELAGVATQESEVYRYSYAELHKVAFEHNVHCHMAIPHEEDIIHLISAQSESTKALFMPMGHRQPMYCTAMGRAILAYLPHNKALDILKMSELKKRTEYTKVTVKEIEQELDRTRRRGYCIIREELSQNKASIAAPIFDRYREPIAAISVSTSMSALNNPEREKELIKVVRSASNKISGMLGYFPC
ncbi:MAG: IclR family transcriptional regulator [Eubacteriales bacterium]|nr:IclR family transcriptional regulator [Eubacteriales bacterium]